MTLRESRRVLIVEDEMMIAMLLEDMLLDLGYLVVGPISDLHNAMRAVQQEEFDAAILDVNLAGQKVYAAAQELAGRGIPFAFATGYGGGGLDGWHDWPVLQKALSEARAVQNACGIDAGRLKIGIPEINSNSNEIAMPSFIL